MTSITEGRGIVATMSYDDLERLTSKTYPNTIAGKTEDVNYSYDTCSFGIGYLCSRIDESGTTNYSFDAYGNLSQTDFSESDNISYTTRYLYDEGNNISQMTLPSGRIIDYSRDGVRRISQIDTTLNGNAQTIVSNIQYRGDNQRTQATFGNGLIDTRNYDLQGRLTDQLLQTASNLLIDQRLYSYDKNGNILNIDTNNEDNNYGYDKLDRIIGDTINTDQPYNFSYDQNNNRLTKAKQDLSLQDFYDYQPLSNRISLQETVQTGISVIPTVVNRELIYNDVGRLFQLIEAGALKADYIYNDAGQRTRKTIYQSDGITIDSITIYHYDQMGYLITETTEQGDLIKDYIWQEGMIPLAQFDSQSGFETITYLHTDHLMTNRLATDEFQNIVWTWQGEAFGNTPAQELAGIKVNLRFPGQYFDQETNLHYNWNRYYDPELGRYITSDPIGLSGGINTFGYVDGNPLSYKDAYGLAKTCTVSPVSLLDEKTGTDKEITDWLLVNAMFQKELENSRAILLCAYNRTVTDITIFYQNYGSALKETCEECGKTVSEQLIDIQWGEWMEVGRTGDTKDEEKIEVVSLPQYKAPARRERGSNHHRAPGQCPSF